MYSRTQLVLFRLFYSLGLSFPLALKSRNRVDSFKKAKKYPFSEKEQFFVSALDHKILSVELSFGALSACLVVVLFWYLSGHISQLITVNGLSTGKKPYYKNVLLLIKRKVKTPNGKVQA